jgi:flagellar assembly protein FliH
MSNIINSKDVKIQKYQFNKMDIEDNTSQEFNNQIFSTTDIDENLSDKNIEEKDEDNTELLEKIDILTSQIVRLQMEIDTQKKDSEQKMEEKNSLQYEKGKEEGIQETVKTLQDDHDTLKNQFIHSITTLDELHSTLEDKFKSIERELIDSAILIAKKVINKEILENSEKVATSIATSLIASIKDATTLTIKVNKNDFSSLSEQFNQDSINIIVDDAVSPGGVIIFSNNANIDATITTRLNQALELIGKE